MRRLVPWLLIALIAVSGAAGAALGIAAHGTSTESPSQSVPAVLATTQQEGSARFSYTQITSSPNPNLRGSLSGQVRGMSYFSGQLPKNVKLPAAFKDIPRGPTTPVATLTLPTFGTSVHLVAPPASAIAADGQSVSTVFLESKSCRSQRVLPD